MTGKTLTAVLLCIFMTGPLAPPAPDAWLIFIPEMEPFSELTAGAACVPDRAPAATDRARAALKGRLADVEKGLTSQKVRELSRWAKTEMGAYARVPPLGKVAWRPARVEDTGKWVLLEGTVDTLPTHSSLVTRWLKVYAVYDVPADTIRRVIVTIRGERLE